MNNFREGVTAKLPVVVQVHLGIASREMEAAARTPASTKSLSGSVSYIADLKTPNLQKEARNAQLFHAIIISLLRAIGSCQPCKLWGVFVEHY